MNVLEEVDEEDASEDRADRLEDDSKEMDIEEEFLTRFVLVRSGNEVSYLE